MAINGMRSHHKRIPLHSQWAVLIEHQMTTARWPIERSRRKHQPDIKIINLRKVLNLGIVFCWNFSNRNVRPCRWRRFKVFDFHKWLRAISFSLLILAKSNNLIMNQFFKFRCLHRPISLQNSSEPWRSWLVLCSMEFVIWTLQYEACSVKLTVRNMYCEACSTRIAMWSAILSHNLWQSFSGVYIAEAIVLWQNCCPQ